MDSLRNWLGNATPTILKNSKAFTMTNELVLFFQSEFGVLVSGIGVFTAVNALFSKVDEYVSKPFRNDVSSWLLNITPKETNSWSVYFAKLFDVLFIKNKTHVNHSHFKFSNYMTRYCFCRSCITSTISVVIVIMIGITLGLIPGDTFYGTGLLLFISINFIPDYISLIQTRYFISILEKKKPFQE